MQKVDYVIKDFWWEVRIPAHATPAPLGPVTSLSHLASTRYRWDGVYSVFSLPVKPTTGCRGQLKPQMYPLKIRVATLV